MTSAGKTPAKGKVLDDSMLADVFSIELEEITLPVKKAEGQTSHSGFNPESSGAATTLGHGESMPEVL